MTSSSFLYELAVVGATIISFLVRPDVVGYLGTILSELKLEEIECTLDIRSELTRLRDFYVLAAKSLQCVIFTTGIL